MTARDIRRWQHSLPEQKGATLLETVVALALIAVVLPALLTGLASAITITDDVYDRSVLFELAQSQMEEIQRQPYQENASNYTLIPAPAGYSLAISATPAASYTYPAPKSSATQETVQLVTVTVTGVRGNLSLQGYKARGIVPKPTPPGPTTVTLLSVADSWVNQNSPNTKYGTDTTMFVRSTTTGPPDTNNRSFMRYDLSSLPAGAAIQSATLRLRMDQAPTASRSYDANRVTASWIESGGGGITWNDQPGVDSTATGTIATGTTANVWLEWDVTYDVQAFVSGTYSNYGWRIKDQVESDPAGDFSSRFLTRENTGTTEDPQLVVTYVP